MKATKAFAFPVMLCLLALVITGCPGDSEDTISGEFPIGVWAAASTTSDARGTTMVDYDTETKIYWSGTLFGTGYSQLYFYDGDKTSNQTESVGTDSNCLFVDSDIEDPTVPPSSRSAPGFAAKGPSARSP